LRRRQGFRSADDNGVDLFSFRLAGNRRGSGDGGRKKGKHSATILQRWTGFFSGIARLWSRAGVGFQIGLHLFSRRLLFFFIPFLIACRSSTPQDRRTATSLALRCARTSQAGWTVSVQGKKSRTRKNKSTGATGSMRATMIPCIRKGPIWVNVPPLAAAKALQFPSLGMRRGGKKAVEYYLVFLAYQENGEPYSSGPDGAQRRRAGQPRFLEKISPSKDAKPQPTIVQLDY